MLICLYAIEVLYREACAMRQLDARMISTAGLKGAIAALLVNLVVESTFAGGPEAMTMVFMLLTLGEAEIRQLGQMQMSFVRDFLGETHSSHAPATIPRSRCETTSQSSVRNTKL